MIASIRELGLSRDLLFMLVWRDIRIRYKQSVMGVLWAVFMPALIVSAGILVKVALASLQGRSLVMADVASVSVKAVPWAFFVASVRLASMSLVGNANLVAKIYMPREVFPLSAVLSQAFDLAVASAVLAVVLVLAQVGVSLQLLWVPVLMLLLVLMATGLGIFLSAACLFFRDVKYIVEVFLTFAIFFTPVFYEAELFGRWATWLMVNPVTPILEGLRDVVVVQRVPDLAWISYSAALGVGGLAAAWVLFKRMEPYFAESL